MIMVVMLFIKHQTLQQLNKLNRIISVKPYTYIAVLYQHTYIDKVVNSL